MLIVWPPHVPPSPGHYPGTRLCERCQKSGVTGVEVCREDSRTCYEKPTPTIWDRLRSEDEGLTPTEQVLEDPNRDVWLCRECAKLHHEYWDEMWDNYNSGRL